jgi:hypothetical protein
MKFNTLTYFWYGYVQWNTRIIYSYVDVYLWSVIIFVFETINFCLQ